MNTGLYISGAAHLGLIGWVILGGALSPAPDPVEVTEVAMISTEAFEAALLAQTPPVATTDVALPVPPAPTDEATPVPGAQTDRTVPRDAPVAEPPPRAEAPPQTVPAPVPRADVTDEVAILRPPEAAPGLPDAPPDTALRPQPRPSDRVTSRPTPPPPADATPAPDRQDAVRPEADAPTVDTETREATAPEASSPEIVTEAERAPESAPRPRARPAARPETPATPSTDRDAVADALAAALDGALDGALDQTDVPAAPSGPAGPPLTRGERDALRVAVSDCWNVGSLSSEALRTTVVVGVSMTRDAKPVLASIRMLSHSGGSEAAARQAFEAARRAVIRCGGRGFPLPADKFEQWQEIEMTFNPDNMRIR